MAIDFVEVAFIVYITIIVGLSWRYGKVDQMFMKLVLYGVCVVGKSRNGTSEKSKD